MNTVESYKLNLGKSVVDQRLLVPDEYKHLIWFLFPSEVAGELTSLKRGADTSFEALE